MTEISISICPELMESTWGYSAQAIYQLMKDNGYQQDYNQNLFDRQLRKLVKDGYLIKKGTYYYKPEADQ